MNQQNQQNQKHLHQPLQSIPKTSYYNSYSNKRKEEQAKNARYKLIIILLQRAVSLRLKSAFTGINTVLTFEYSRMQKFLELANKNHRACLKMAMQKMGENVLYYKWESTLLKNSIRIIEKAESLCLKEAMGLMVLYVNRKNKATMKSFNLIRRASFVKKCERAYTNRRAEAFQKILKYSQYQRRVLKKVRIAGIIGKQYIKNIKQACFNRLVKANNLKATLTSPQKTINTPPPPQRTNNLLPSSLTNDETSKKLPYLHHIPKHIAPLKQENQEMKIQIQDMEVQIDNKNESICRLEQEIEQLKENNLQQQQERPQRQYYGNNNNNNSYYNNSFSEYGNISESLLNRSNSRSQKKFNKNNQSNNGDDSMDSGAGSEFNLGSILGNSFSSLNRSRSKKRGGGSIVSTECSCIYKEKYFKFKNSNESLKNQLEIVKEELEVAKDLNDHFTTEIRQYFGGEKEEIELDRLRKESKDLQTERDELRNKVTKYQHTIATLKSEFRLKIEELYRKVRKER